MLSDEEKNNMELDIEAKYVGRTGKEFLSNITYAECLYILDTKNKYCDDIKNLSLLKIVDIVEKQSKEIEELKKDKLELINKNHVVHLKDVEKELREMRKVIDTKNAEIECLNVIHESYKEMVEENNFISKDKIKAKIEEVKDGTFDAKIVLQSLLEKE